VTGAKAGTLSFLVGGSEQSFTRASPILAHMGQRIIHCGPAGSGLAAKICNNLVLGVEQIVVAEAMLLGQRLGLDPAVLAGVINNSTGACWSSSVNNPVPGALPDKSPPCERGFEGGFATGLMIKAGDVKGLFIDQLTGSDRIWDWQRMFQRNQVPQCRWPKPQRRFISRL
jgi:3-hydroxyisobutyrate dehydrogenase